MKHARKSSMSPESRAVLDHLRKKGPATVGALMEVAPADTRISLRKRLGNLERSGWLQREIVQEVVVWSIRPSARDLFEEAELPRTAPKAAPFIGVPALPRRINVMEAPNYSSPQSLATRHGAFDFMHVPSHGVRC